MTEEQLGDVTRDLLQVVRRAETYKKYGLDKIDQAMLDLECKNWSGLLKFFKELERVLQEHVTKNETSLTEYQLKKIRGIIAVSGMIVIDIEEHFPSNPTIN